MMALVLALTTFGVLMIYSADQIQTTRASGVIHYQRQLLWLIFSVIGLVVVSAFSSRVVETVSYFTYGLLLIGLIAILLTGHGVERWLSIPGTGINFQVAELAKLTTILALASYLANRKKKLDSLKDLILPVFIVLLPAALTLLQPDLGTSIIFFFILYAMLYWSGLPLIYLFLLLSPLISFFLALIALLGELRFPLWGMFFIFLCVLIFYNRIYLMDAIFFTVVNLLTGILTSPLWNSLKPYQQNRILVFFQPERDPQGSGWQIIQSKVAIGSGGLLGKGYLEGTQKNLAFLPAQHTDFIFPLVGEEFGFLGIALALALFFFLLYRIIELARVSSTNFASLTAVGIASFLFGHIIINVGMTVGLMPITGLPLPLFSYGGSFLLTCYLSVGVLQCIYLERSGL
ncbi:MAG: rod shape-determining protein RodA [Candidatus Glassbacteria bacterium RIFCSPLOWO2_12_FULL_58_11]|uniref:Rod shape-determining protein RodA n=1 Tax=Candidatus Glassbacteria bacterium RIFCSPLOWO2_12_FULL_58_11 TaxID=1817867 RepID=A0A1F5YRG4_9BACT|nr:MAG: rod shape-determining protein RodA [Candidatus Glassbacteria bacterium RIFCSPLOWO2_12_FULL_58_11]